MSDQEQQIFWHRELPPFKAEAIGEHVLEASSHHIEGTLAHRDEQWDQCYESLMEQVRARLVQKIDLPNLQHPKTQLPTRKAPTNHQPPTRFWELAYVGVGSCGLEAGPLGSWAVWALGVDS